MAQTRRVVLDVLKPHDPSIQSFAAHVADLDGVDGATAALVERDVEVENISLAAEGDDVDLDAIRVAIESLGGSVHSLDVVSCGTVDVDTPGHVQE